MAFTNYATLAQVKDYLWITDTSNDSLIQHLLNSSYYLLNKLIWVTTLNGWSVTEELNLGDIYKWVWYYWFNIYLKNKPVSAITKINWTAYTWVKWTDYMITYDRKLTIKDLDNYIVSLNFDVFEIEYTAWYNRDDSWVDTLPDDIKLMQMMLVSWLYNKKGNEWIHQYRLWDESISFWSQNNMGADDMYFSFKTMLDKYKSFYLP